MFSKRFSIGVKFYLRYVWGYIQRILCMKGGYLLPRVRCRRLNIHTNLSVSAVLPYVTIEFQIDQTLCPRIC